MTEYRVTKGTTQAGHVSSPEGDDTEGGEIVPGFRIASARDDAGLNR